jgi:hypothetical protein
MRKTNKPIPKTSAGKAPAAKQSAAKPKAKAAAKPNPRKAQSQGELLPIIERLTQAAEQLAQAAERLADTALPTPSPEIPNPEPCDSTGEISGDENFKTLSESIGGTAEKENE